MPEELTETPIPNFADRPQRFEETGPREPRQPDMVGGVWFTLSLGRKHRADPKWLLPMICKAGGVTKRDVGSIKIQDTETRFEIAADKAAAFAAAIAKQGTLEKGVMVRPAGDMPAAAPRAYAKPKYEGKPQDGKPKYDAKPKYEAKREAKPQREDGPRYKLRTDDGRKLASKPAREVTPPVIEKPRPPKTNPKDKGKPKYKNRPQHQAPIEIGAAPRKLRKSGYDPLG